MKRIASALFLMCWMQLAGAIDTAPAFSDPAMQERYSHIIHQLRCVQCRSQSIADSNVSLAADLRRQVRELMAAGKSDADIFTYMTNRYGDYVLYDPPLAPRTWLLWAAPLLLVGIGAFVAVTVIVRKSHLPVDGDAGEDHGIDPASETGET
ncbi:MAG: cytochrome c-type biogenesis protein [Steroidobacteraceae bacterium]